MDIDPPSYARRAPKRPHDAQSDDAHSGETPAAKRFQPYEEPGPEPESEGEDIPSPSKPATLKKKSIPPHLTAKKQTAKNTPSPPPPPRFHRETTPDIVATTSNAILPMAFSEVQAPTEALTLELPPSPLKEINDIDPETGGVPIDSTLNLQGDWDEDPETTVANMLENWNTSSEVKFAAEAPSTTPGEWHIFRTDPARPDLDHHSDNPFDFLHASKLHSLLRFMAEKPVPMNELSIVERQWLGRPSIKKILVKVVHEGPPLEDDSKSAWFRAATISAIAQCGKDVALFAKSHLAIDPMKPGYGWVIVPIGAALFKALEGVRGALDPKSGTLVLFRFWKEIPCPRQRIYAFGLHHDDDDVPHDVAVTDYKNQMEKALAGGGVGDWNFVEDQVDRSPQHPDDRVVTREMARLKASLELIDGWRKAHPTTHSFTWEGTTGNERRKIFSRIDRIYISAKTWQTTNEYKIISCDVSDHDGVSVMVRNSSAPEAGTGEQKLCLKILNHQVFKREALRLLNKLERKLNKYDRLAAKKNRPGKENALRNLRTTYNPQIFWQEYKNGILRASEMATQSRRKELTEFRRAAERNIRTAENALRACSPESEEECRKTLSEEKKVLSTYEEEMRSIRTNLKEAKWSRVNEKSSKLWFSLNKTRPTGPVIASLIDPTTNEETNDPMRMLKIARTHHSELQSEPPMNYARKQFIDAILAGMTKVLDDDEKKEISKEVKYEEVRNVLRRAPNGKAPGPDGIPNEFWKEEIKWREKMKKDKKFKQGDMSEEGARVRPCIAALMTKVLEDVESFGAMDEKFAEARMGLLYKKKDKREIQNYRPITLLLLVDPPRPYFLLISLCAVVSVSTIVNTYSFLVIVHVNK